MEKINKRSGNIKRACKKKYLQILASNPETVCSYSDGSSPDIIELEKIIPRITQYKPENNRVRMDYQNADSEDTYFGCANDVTTF